MTEIIGIPFGWIMYFIYSIFKNYGIALIVFTLVTKLILLPFATKQQKSMAKTQRLNPKLKALQQKYGKNKEKYQEEMMKLYSEEGVNPMGSCLPLLIQFPILFGLIDVVYRPLTHILRMSKDTISTAVEIINNSEALASIAGQAQFKNRPELFIMQAVDKAPEAFSEMGTNFVQSVSTFEYSFLGLPMGENPTWSSILVLIPIISLIANLLVTVVTQRIQKINNAGAPSMSGGMNTMLYIMPLFSFFFAFKVPAGVGLYWIFSSLFSCLQSYLLFKVYTPERMEVILEKEKKKKKKKGPSFYEKAMEAQRAQQGNTHADADYVYPGDENLTKAQIKEFNKQRLNEARRKIAEKYGDTYNEKDE